MRDVMTFVFGMADIVIDCGMCSRLLQYIKSGMWYFEDYVAAICAIIISLGSGLLLLG